MKLRYTIEKTTRKKHGVRESEYRIRYWWPARRGEPRRSKVDPQTFRYDRNAQEHALGKLREIEAHEAGLGPDPFAETPKNLPGLVDSFLKALASGALSKRGRRGAPKADQVERVEQRLKLLCDRLSLRHVGDLVAIGPEINERLAKLQVLMRAEAGNHRRTWGEKTRDEYGLSLKQLCAWLVVRDVLKKNPLDGLRLIATDASRTFFRRALDIDELGLLMGAAEASGPGGKERATLWAFASFTGLRESEIASLVWGDLKLEDGNPRLEIDASRTKTSKAAGQLIPPWLSKRLLEQRGMPTAAVFAGYDWHNVCDLLRRDAVAAGLGKTERKSGRTAKGEKFYFDVWIDPSGPKWTLDFHALRHAFATMLDEPHVGDRDWADLARHSNPAMTRRYRHAKGLRHRAIIDAMPEPVCTACAPRARSGSTAGNPGQETQAGGPEATSCEAAS